jgi:hypothetical protein
MDTSNIMENSKTMDIRISVGPTICN